MRCPTPTTLLAIALLLPACAGSPAGGAASAARPSDQRVIGYEELQDAITQNLGSLYQLVSSRRPEWLRPSLTSARGTITEVAVWMDNQRLGGPDALRTIPLRVVVEARLLTPSEAQARLGMNNLGGAILVITQR